LLKLKEEKMKGDILVKKGGLLEIWEKYN